MIKKILKYSLFILLLAIIFFGFKAYKFIDRAKNGIDRFETDPVALEIDTSLYNVLVVSKMNGFEHTEAVEAAIPEFSNMAKNNSWDLHHINSGAVFNDTQLALFDVVVWNNVTGPILTETQRASFKNYILSGGGFVALHGAGDDSHHWDWYYEDVLKTKFSHHSMNPQIQEGTLTLEVDTTYSELFEDLDEQWTIPDEWYVFFENPRAKGAKVLYTLNEANISINGSIPILAPDKDFGMGEDHPAVWYHVLGKGKVFYSSLGHNAASIQNKHHLKMLENAILWAGDDN